MVQNPERGGSDNMAGGESLGTYSQEIRASRNPVHQLVVEVWALLKTWVVLGNIYVTFPSYNVTSHSSNVTAMSHLPHMNFIGQTEIFLTL